MYNVFRVSLHDTAKFLKVSIPFSKWEDARAYAERLAATHPADWPVTIVAKVEKVKPLR